MTGHKGKLVILYGSQTGNAEDLAKRIGHRAKRLNYLVTVQTMDKFLLASLPKLNDHVIFVCSTTGHGQEPENMKRFYNFIRRRDLPNDCLKNLKFSIYGLGDSSYAKFNYVAKILFKRLINCGARALQDLVLGDEQHHLGCDGMIYPKLDELFSKLDSVDSNVKEDALPDCSYDVTFYQDPNHLPGYGLEFNSSYVESQNIKVGTCLTNERVTSEDHFQDTRFLVFKSEESIIYEPGDVCAILPENSDENIRLFLDTLQLDPDQRFAIQKKDPNYMIDYLYDFIPNGLRIYDLVKCYLDIQSVPKRSFFEFLWPFSDNELERDKLKEFATTEGQEEMYEYCIQPKRSILEVLVDFPHSIRNIQFKYLFDLIPPIKPRSFSIASALAMHPNEIHLIVGVVKYQTRMKKTRTGLCSTYLSKLRPQSDKNPSASSIKFTLKSTSFKLPRTRTTPIIMIGPGLGIAPFRSFIEARSSENIANNSQLYFGCRFKDKDFYFEDELNQYAETGSIRLSVAFSREGSRQYVQDLLKEDANLINSLIEEHSAVVYVAGNSKLPEDVRKTIGDILIQSSGDNLQRLDSTEGIQLVAKLESKNRIQYDCW